MATDGDNKKLCNLRVVDLRAELEKRGLDKTGVRPNLIERLQKALIQEGKDPEEYEFDLSDKKPIRSFRPDEHGSNVDQSSNDSLVLMIETPNLDSTDTPSELEKEKDVEKNDESTYAESPLNLSIGAEEENLLLNSGDEHEKPTEDEKTKVEDDKTAVSNGSSSDNSKELDNAGKGQNDNKDDNGEEQAVTEVNGSDSMKRVDATLTVHENTVPGVPIDLSAIAKTSSESEKGKAMNEKDKEIDKTKSNPGRSLWVTNLLPSTRAQELKHLLSRYGKIIGAKVVQSSRYPRQRCYGYVTMESRAAADLCIEKLNNTELKGQIIRVSKVRLEHSLPMKSQKQPDSKDKDKKNGTPEKNDKENIEKKTTSSPTDKNIDIKRESRERESTNTSTSGNTKKNRNFSKSSGHRPDRKSEILIFDKEREERERQRRERERILREEEKHRREIQRVREIEKRQREEAIRLEREREKLRIERERLDRQREEIMRLERERQRLEREKLEQEKQELRRQQMRLEEARRPVKRSSSTSVSSYRRDGSNYSDDHKRISTERHYDETPPAPRFEVSREPAPEIPAKKDVSKDYKSRNAYSKRTEEYKRDYSPAERHASSHSSHLVHNITSSTNPLKYESSTYVNRERERDVRREAIIPSVPSPRISKDTRYEEQSSERSPVYYRPVRDEHERRPVADHHTKRDHRYTETALKEGTRYRESNSWHSSSTPAVKSFNSTSANTNSSHETWGKSDNWRPMDNASNERWGNNSSRLLMSNSSGVPNTVYSGGYSNMSGMGPGMICTQPPGNSSYSMDRFDRYKPLNSSRKY